MFYHICHNHHQPVQCECHDNECLRLSQAIRQAKRIRSNNSQHNGQSQRGKKDAKLYQTLWGIPLDEAEAENPCQPQNKEQHETTDETYQRGHLVDLSDCSFRTVFNDTTAIATSHIAKATSALQTTKLMYPVFCVTFRMRSINKVNPVMIHNPTFRTLLIFIISLSAF